MMNYIVITLGLASLFALSQAEISPECCSMEDRRLVVNEWNEQYHTLSGRFKSIIGKLVLKGYWERANGTRELYRDDGSDDIESPRFTAFAFSFINEIDMMINLFFDVPTLKEYVASISEYERETGTATKEHFSKLGDSLHEVLEQFLSHFSSYAWENCFEILGDKLTAGIA